MTSDQNLSTTDLANPAPRTATTDHDAAGSEAGSQGSSAAGATRPEPLLPPEESERYRRDWENVQTRFVDAPRARVGDAARSYAAGPVDRCAWPAERSGERWIHTGGPATSSVISK